jgi:dTMP kinase
MRGFFVTIEGIEGSGKTTQTRLLAEALRRHGRAVMLTHEPGATPAGAAIRRIFLDASIPLDRTAELLLVLADRAQHVREQLAEELQRGTIVISDRYCDSTIAYQGYGRRFDLKLLDDLNRFAGNGLVPDLTLILDCPVEVGLRRVQERRSSAAPINDRFEGENAEFHQRVRDGFLAIARREPARTRVIDATPARELVAATIQAVVTTALEGR